MLFAAVSSSLISVFLLNSVGVYSGVIVVEIVLITHSEILIDSQSISFKSVLYISVLFISVTATNHSTTTTSVEPVSVETQKIVHLTAAAVSVV
jgi:hypothetical protein